MTDELAVEQISNADEVEGIIESYDEPFVVQITDSDSDAEILKEIREKPIAELEYSDFKKWKIIPDFQDRSDGDVSEASHTQNDATSWRGVIQRVTVVKLALMFSLSLVVVLTALLIWERYGSTINELSGLFTLVSVLFALVPFPIIWTSIWRMDL